MADDEGPEALATLLEPSVYRQAARGEVWRGIASVPLLAGVTMISVFMFVDLIWGHWLQLPSGSASQLQTDQWSTGVVLVVCIVGVNAMGLPPTVARLQLRSMLHAWEPASMPSLHGTVTEKRWTRVIVDVANSGSPESPPGRLTLPRDDYRVRGLRAGDPVLVEGVVQPGSWVAVTTPKGIGWVRLLPRRGWRLTSM